jgi:hypothetical protein
MRAVLNFRDLIGFMMFGGFILPGFVSVSLPARKLRNQALAKPFFYHSGSQIHRKSSSLAWRRIEAAPMPLALASREPGPQLVIGKRRLRLSALPRLACRQKSLHAAPIHEAGILNHRLMPSRTQIRYLSWGGFETSGRQRIPVLHN